MKGATLLSPAGILPLWRNGPRRSLRVIPIFSKKRKPGARVNLTVPECCGRMMRIDYRFVFHHPVWNPTPTTKELTLYCLLFV
jgi:hypothetical protein